MQTIFDPSRLSDLQNVNFGAPLVDPAADLYCPECGEFHEPQARYSEPWTPPSRPAALDAIGPVAPVGRAAERYAPFVYESREADHAAAMRIAAIPDRKVRKGGPDDCDRAYAAAFTASLDGVGSIEPPAGATADVLSGFLAGLRDGAAERHRRELIRVEEALQDEADAEMAASSMAWVEG